MATMTIDIQELPAQFAELLSLAGAGTEVVVMEGNVPRARLLPFSPAQGRTPGLHPGAIQTTEDFDDPLPEDFWAGKG